MSYITAADVVARVGESAAVQLTTDSGTSVDTDMITTLITQVEGRVHGFIRRRMATPVVQSTHPNTYAALQGVVMDMTACQLAARRPPVPPDWKTANDQAVAWLTGLAKGEIDLPDAELNEPGIEYGGEDQNAAEWR